jgi:hypothetical protein
MEVDMSTQHHEFARQPQTQIRAAAGLGALALALLLAPACGGDSKTKDPTGGTGGVASDGAAGTGGVGAGGAGGAGGRTDASTNGGMASVKFCNELESGMMSIDLFVEIGQPVVRLTAASGKCSTMKGATCATIPANKDTSVSLFYSSMRLSSGTIDITGGTEIVLIATLTDDPQPQPTLIGGVLNAGVTCANFDLEEVTDGGAPNDGAGSADGGAKPVDGAVVPPKI